MKRRMNRKNQKSIWIIGALSSVLLAILIFIGIRLQKQEPDVYYFEEEMSSEETDDEMSETAEEAETLQEDEEVSTQPEEIIYPEPEYEFATEEVTLAIEGLGREYTIAWVSDLHLVSDHEAGEELGDVHGEYLDAINKRYEEMAVTSDGVHAEELWPEIVKYLNYNDFDGIIFGGDMMDYCSNSNIEIIKEGLDSLHVPYIYVRADHDYGAYYGGVFFTETEARELHKTIDGDEISYKFWDMGEFIVLGIDNSTKDMPEYYLNMVADVYTRGKPVIMATHVPYESKVDNSLAELSMQVRNTIYYWSDVSNHYKPNVITRQYLDLIYSEDTVVKQVLSGHMHAGWDGMITQQVSQHVFNPAYLGYIGIIHVVPASE
ncbi:MAG: metallophosphoesterase [Lachnospiraceae bacterium]|nr:metallophosphoesterase [Lachnospiraceae bacterium]